MDDREYEAADMVMGAQAVIEALRVQRYPAAAGWAVLEQVANGTGNAARRWLDLLAVSLWPSRGIQAEGIEVKVSRADWRRERKDPKKADEVAKYCARFWVAAPEGIVPVDELPPAWGLLEVTTDGKVLTAKPAAPLTPEAPTWPFVAAVLRRAAEAHQQQLQSRVEATLEATVTARLAARGAAEVEAAVAARHAELVEQVRVAQLELKGLQRRHSVYEEVEARAPSLSPGEVRDALVHAIEHRGRMRAISQRGGIARLRDQLNEALKAIEELQQ